MTDRTDVLVVGGGVAGLTAATFTARAGLDTLVVSTGESILARNAHLENVPGFPAGVDARRFLSLCAEGAERNGVALREGRVTDLREEGRFVAETEAGEELEADYVIAASWSDASYLDSLGVDRKERGSKTYLDPDPEGRTSVPGIYAAGRVAGAYHQTVVAAGDGATAGLTLLHDWVAPEGYFSERGREIPPGCEEISEAEHERRAKESRELMRERFAEPYPDSPTMHPSVVEKREGDR